jgi:Coenzyme PQQ synthesis protein D (PqqD)
MIDKYIKPSRDTAARMLDGEMVIISVRDSSVYNLNLTATAIWNGADGRTPLREIVSRMVLPEFEVDANVAYQDALELVEELEREGILLVADYPLDE